jgi:putative ABC transport system substrate-binding protein
MVREQARAVVVQSILATPRVADLALRHHLPTVTSARRFVEAGGLISFGARLPDLYRRTAYFVDRILKGAKPADLPVEQPTKFDLVVNLETAKALGLTIPPSVLARADEVLQRRARPTA